ncbi:B3 domain-containing protein REM9-like isoform X2 [Chenopodium quinoa]|uniref:B3 domain-containing protein REM9-like isoform X2 n=1 Tax=Chenopodium quinoa TaxID=63459 RepID=UPI000B78FED8|nr:B3 domain-containing protein REM9-like isoform X2 [Chenopodium quinoa]
MRIFHRPKKPHFFQPLLPDFPYNFSLPKSFLKNLGRKKLKKNDEKKAKLRDKKGRSWDVKLVTSSGDIRPHFKDGWEKFCKECDLHVGDFLVFRHQGNFIFDVYIFDHTACERDLPILLESRLKIEASKNPKNIKSPRITKKMLKVEDKGEIKMREDENSTFKPSSYPYCHTIMTYGPGAHEMPLPREFAEKNGLSKRWCEMELIDEKGHSWKMLLRHYRRRINGGTYIGSWNAFRKANGLNTGNAVIFELIHSGERPIMRFYSMKKK